ncbi:MAG: hypothetical protein P8Y64_05710 [Gammaproteobacteria bacterium]
MLDMALRRASAAARLDVPLPAAAPWLRAAGTGAAAVWAGAALRAAESARVRLAAEALSAALPALDKALRLASANARPLICALVCCVMSSPV